jgi:HlyD family secretion protein
MTADIICEVARHENVFKIPNAALRFKPERTNGESSAEKTVPGRTGHRPRIWISPAAGGSLRPVPVTLGITDGAFTEVGEPTSLVAGEEVVIGLQTSENTKKTVNPFTPQMPGRRPAR